VLKIDPRTGAKEVLADIGPGLDNVAFVNGRTFISHITGSIHEIVAPGQAKALIDKGLQWPLGLAVGEDGEIFVADGGFTYTLRPGGELQLAGMLFSEGFPGWVRDAAAARGPGEWLVTTANGTVARWRPAEQAFEELASGFDRLMGIARVPGKAVVFAEYGTGRVLSQGGGTHELATGLDRPMGVAVAGDETVYVAESGASRVVKLVGGKTETVVDGLGQPEGIAIAGSKLYVVDTGAKEVVEYDLVTGTRQAIATQLPVGAPAGVIAKQLGSVGDMCGPMTTMAGIAVAADGTIYAAAAAEGSVLAIKPA
jgi:sugar lactone lactonase YvrE